MNYTKTNPIGIDKVIQKLQVKLYDNLGFDGIDGYGRIYPIERDDKTIPAHFITGTDYKDVFFNDKESDVGNFFFYENQTTKPLSSAYETEINIVFQLDPSKITNGTSQRNDEEIRAKIDSVLLGSPFELIEITRGLKALEDFDHNLRDRKLCFLRFKGNVRYKINC